MSKIKFVEKSKHFEFFSNLMLIDDIEIKFGGAKAEPIIYWPIKIIHYLF